MTQDTAIVTMEYICTRDLYKMSYSMQSFRITCSDLAWLSEIFNDTIEARAVSPRQLSFLSFILFYFIILFYYRYRQFGDGQWPPVATCSKFISNDLLINPLSNNHKRAQTALRPLHCRLLVTEYYYKMPYLIRPLQRRPLVSGEWQYIVKNPYLPLLRKVKNWSHIRT